MCFTVSPSGKAMSGPIVTKSSHSLVVDAGRYLPFEPRHEDQQRGPAPPLARNPSDNRCVAADIRLRPGDAWTVQGDVVTVLPT
jgi:hypothetical protein